MSRQPGSRSCSAFLSSAIFALRLWVQQQSVGPFWGRGEGSTKAGEFLGVQSQPGLEWDAAEDKQLKTLEGLILGGRGVSEKGRTDPVLSDFAWDTNDISLNCLSIIG